MDFQEIQHVQNRISDDHGMRRLKVKAKLILLMVFFLVVPGLAASTNTCTFSLYGKAWTSHYGPYTIVAQVEKNGKVTARKVYTKIASLSTAPYKSTNLACDSNTNLVLKVVTNYENETFCSEKIAFTPANPSIEFGLVGYPGSTPGSGWTSC